MSITIRRASSEDITTLLPLVQAYWHFEAIEGFDPDRVGAELERLLADDRLGAALGRGNEAGRAFYRQEGYAPRAGFELLDKALGPPRS